MKLEQRAGEYNALLNNINAVNLFARFAGSAVDGSIAALKENLQKEHGESLVQYTLVISLIAYIAINALAAHFPPSDQSSQVSQATRNQPPTAIVVPTQPPSSETNPGLFQLKSVAPPETEERDIIGPGIIALIELMNDDNPPPESGKTQASRSQSSVPAAPVGELRSVAPREPEGKDVVGDMGNALSKFLIWLATPPESDGLPTSNTVFQSFQAPSNTIRVAAPVQQQPQQPQQPAVRVPLRPISQRTPHP